MRDVSEKLKEKSLYGFLQLVFSLDTKDKRQTIEVYKSVLKALEGLGSDECSIIEGKHKDEHETSILVNVMNDSSFAYIFELCLEFNQECCLVNDLFNTGVMRINLNTHEIVKIGLSFKEVHPIIALNKCNGYLKIKDKYYIIQEEIGQNVGELTI